jgi:hypothetical protein
MQLDLSDTNVLNGAHCLEIKQKFEVRSVLELSKGLGSWIGATLRALDEGQ